VRTARRLQPLRRAQHRVRPSNYTLPTRQSGAVLPSGAYVQCADRRPNERAGASESFRPRRYALARDRDVGPAEANELHGVCEARQCDRPLECWRPVRVGARLLCQELLFGWRGR